MTALTRTVKRLHLRSAEPAGVRRAALLLEDAMRTATLPDHGGRLLMVRHLSLGTIDTGAPPQSVALALERKVAALAPSAVRGDTSSAAAAPAVWFHDHLDAVTRLALILADGRRPDAWYWPLAVPAWTPAMPRRQALRTLALDLAARPEAPAALPAWTAALAAAGHAETLAAALEPGDVQVLARAAGLPAPRVPKWAPTPEDPPKARDQPGGSDPRRQLIRQLLCVAAEVPGLVFPEQRDTGSALLPEMPVNYPELSDARGFGLHHQSSPVSHHAVKSPLVSRDQTAPLLPTQTIGPQYEVDAALTPVPFTGLPTTAGGLLFLIPALVRLGYPQWLAENPDWIRHEIAVLMFSEILERLNVGPDDPVWTLATTMPTTDNSPQRFVAPPVWRAGLTAGHGPFRIRGSRTAGVLSDASGRLLLGAWYGPQPRTLLPLLRTARHDCGAPESGLVSLTTHAWLTACRRWLHRFAGIGLADLVRRPANLTLTQTHADLNFGHEQADLRLRRAGLDLDPGWVPWLGRVVTFHYVPQCRP